MKEAAGEANLTVVAIILIGVVVAVVTPLVRSLMSTTAKRACCTDAGYVWDGNHCEDSNGQEQSNYWNNQTNQCNNNGGSTSAEG